MKRLQKAVENYSNWVFKEEGGNRNGFMLLCMVVGFALYVFGPPSLLFLAFLLVAAPGVPVINRILRPHPGKEFIRAMNPEYLEGFTDHFTDQMRARGVPEGMIVMDVGLVWIYKNAEDHRSMFLHMLNLTTKVEKIDGVSGVHETELSELPASEDASVKDGEDL